jgi:hypothetical protein
MASVKCFAECLLSGTWQRALCLTLGKELFAECQALGKKCTREPGKDTPADGNHPAVTLCRVPTVRHSAKFYLFICFVITLPSARNLTLGQNLAISKEF